MRKCALAAVLLVAALAAGQVEAATKPWTIAQAKRALYDARRIKADDVSSISYGPDRNWDYIFQVAEIEIIRPFGPKRHGGWRAFEVSAYVDLLRDVPSYALGGIMGAEQPDRVTFCLHPVGKSFRLAGVDFTFTRITRGIPRQRGCRSPAKGLRLWVGGPIG